MRGQQVLHTRLQERCRIFTWLFAGAPAKVPGGVVMRARRSFASLWIAGLSAGIVCAACFAAVDQSQAVPASASKSHRKAAKKPPPPPLPPGPRGPGPQISLDSMQAVAPHVTYQDGQLTIVAPNSTLADILRAVRKLTGAEMDIPPNANERVVTNLGPGPAPGVVAELLTGSRTATGTSPAPPATGHHPTSTRAPTAAAADDTATTGSVTGLSCLRFGGRSSSQLDLPGLCYG